MDSYEELKRAGKTQSQIIEMFDKIAKTYDLANRILSMGIDKLWRKEACDKSFDFYDKQILDTIVDVACGTGDLMIDWQNIADKKGIKINKIIGVDPSVGMLEVAKTKIPNGTFIEATAQNIPLEDNSVDIISISYGIRNVLQRQEALEEFARVLKKGGLCVILEFTKNDKNDIFAKITNFYLNKIMPIIGGLISKDKDAYTYLPLSINKFASTKELKMQLESVGLESIFVKGYSLDISTTFIARKN